MSFLEPLFLMALPLAGLPIIIHLLNQRRHKTAPWAAREFVLQASNMARGAAAIRHWIVLVLRTLAIAALIFALSRPLISRVPGLGFLGTQRAQIVVMDRSPSMALRDSTNGLTWRESGLSQLQEHLQTRSGHQVLFHSLSDEPVSIPSGNLLDMLETTLSDTQSNIPELLELALRYIQSQAIGPTDVWVCTDRQASDFQLESGRWTRVREQIESLSGVKLHFLTPEPREEFNLAISVSEARVERSGEDHFLSLDFEVAQTGGEVLQRTVPVEVFIDGGQGTVEIEVVAREFKYQRLKLGLPPESLSGGGVIRLPHDANERDNQFYFSYAQEPVRHAVVVSDDPEIRELLELVCSTPFNTQCAFKCTSLPVLGQGEINWGETALVLWQAPLPRGAVAGRLKQFVEGGGYVLFMPPESGRGGDPLFDVGWGEWEHSDSDGLDSPDDDSKNWFQLAQWRGADDLLATDEAGRALPLASVSCRRRCFIQSNSATMLASFEDAQPLLVRAATDSGGAYFLATTPDEDTSTFTQDGVALYVMIHRALEQGSLALAGNQFLSTGDLSVEETRDWKPLEICDRAVAQDQRAYFAGVYASADRVIAINRPISEDVTASLESEDVEAVLDAEAFSMITASSGSVAGLSDEIWKSFVIFMVIALIAEGWFSLPARPRTSLAVRVEKAA